MLDDQERSAPPLSTARKARPINREYEERAKAQVREAMRAQGVTVEEMARRLGGLGVEITPGALANKISRGGFSAAFMLQCHDALGGLGERATTDR